MIDNINLIIIAATEKLKIGDGKISEGKVDIPRVTADDNTVAGVLNVIYGLAASVAVLVIVVAGIMFVISRGDEAHIVQAKKAIISAVIGLGVVLTAAIITQFVLGRF